MTASRVFITWLSRKSRSLTRCSRGLPATWNMDVAHLLAEDSGALAWHIWTFSDRMHRRPSVLLPLARPRAH